MGRATKSFANAKENADASVPEGTANRILLSLIAASTLVFTWLACRQFHGFSTETNEITYYSYALFHTSSERFLPLYFMEGNLLGAHPNIFMVLLLPIYKLVPTVELLFLAQSLLLSVSAWPLYLLLKRQVDDTVTALLFTAAYLMFPPVVSQHLNQIHDDQFANVWLLLAAYYFCAKRFGWFLVPLALICLTKEYFGLTAAMFGVWAWLDRRSWCWVIAPLLLGFGYFLLASKVLMPWVGGISNIRYATLEYLSGYGATPGEIAQTMLRHPGLVLRTTFSAEKIAYLLKLLGPVLLVLPFLTPALVLCAPNLAMNLVGTNSAFLVIPWHYGVFLGAALFVSVACGLPRALKLVNSVIGRNLSPRYLGVAVMAGSLLGTAFWFDSSRLVPVPHHEVLRKVVSIIPQDASVLCPSPLLAHLSDRRAVNTAYSLLVNSKQPERLLDYDYLVLDGNWRNYETIGQAQLVQLLNQNPNLGRRFQILLNEQNVYLLKQLR